MTLVQSVLANPAAWWEEVIDLVTRRGRGRATRRGIIVHLLMHSIRHYAQLATLVRQHGITPDWPMDCFFMGGQIQQT